MTELVLGAAPAGNPSESGNPAAAQTNAATTNPQTDSGEGGEVSPVAERTFTQKELDEIIKREKARTEAKTERRVLRTIERFAPQQQPQPSQQQPASDGRPQRGQFKTEEDYDDARDAWRDQQREHKANGAKTEKFYAEAEKLPGFDRDAFDDLPLTQAMARAMLDSDIAPRLMHHLVTNPDEVKRIAELPPARQAAAIGKLEAKLESEPLKPPKSSKAPDPSGNPAAGAGNTPVVSGDLGKLSMDKYQAERARQGARWAQR